MDIMVINIVYEFNIGPYILYCDCGIQDKKNAGKGI
jgi:hypothetical protein